MEKPTLIRGLGPVSGICMVAGSVIGSGVFLVAADISRSVPSSSLALSVWAVAGFLSLLGGLTFAELGAMYPGTGGQYVYLREAFGPLPAFLYGWTLFLVIQSGTIAAVCIAFAKFFSALLPLSPLGQKLTASAAIILLTMPNLLGIKKGAALLDGLTSLKILALLAIAAAGLWASTAPGAGLGPIEGFAAPAYGVGLIAAFWAYDGWNNLTFVGGEMKDPQRNIPLSLIVGLVCVTLLYLGANFAYYQVLPSPAVAAAAFPAADAARVLGGESAVLAIGLLVLLSTLGCANAMILAGPRVTYAMAEDGSLPAWLCFVHPRFRVPTNALLAQMAWSVLLVWSGRYDQLFTYVISAGFIFYGLTGAAVPVLRRKRPEAERPYRVPLYPVLPGLYVLFCAVFVLNSFREKPVESLAGLGIVLLGIPVYRRFHRRAP